MPSRVAAQAAVSISCAPGVVYSINATPGQLQRINPDGSWVPVGAPANATTQLNGLGIGAGGTSVIAYDRGPNPYQATFLRFNPGTGTWSSTGHTFNSETTANGGAKVNLIAGAVDLSTGLYYFGGFFDVAKKFRLWSYNPATGQISLKGTIATDGLSDSANGDIAFDNQGNLFIVRNENNNFAQTQTKIFSVTNEALQAAGGNVTIPASEAFGQSTVGGVNGIAFDSNGKVYLGTAASGGTERVNAITAYDMPGFTNRKLVNSANLGTTDLATCSSPPTITIEKDVVSRVNTGDQFKLNLNSGSTTLATATTTGSANGVQKEQVGPLPVARGTSLTFGETPAGTTNLGRYASRYSCTADGKPISPSGSGTGTTFTFPATGDEVICRITNAPATADVTINKKTQDQSGGNEQNASGWTVGAKATAASGTVSKSPTADTQTTDASGNAKWTLNFGSNTSSARLAVSEQQQTGYEFASGTCRITRFDGTTANVTLTGAAEQTLSEQVRPGDTVECGYVNKKSSADVTVNKKWVIDGKTIDNGSQPSGMSAKLLLDPAGQGSGEPAFGQKRTGFAVGDTVKIGETATIDSQKFPGCSVKSKTISGPGITGTVALTDTFSTKLPGASNVYTLTNTVECQTLTITKDVENDNGGELTAADWNQRLFATRDGGAAVPFDSGEKKYVTSGTYLISENSLPGYEQVSIRCTGATFDEKTKKVSIAAGQNAECIVANADSAGTVSWEKTSESGDLLDGSEWTIRDADGNEIDLDDCVAASAEGCSGRDRNPKAGQFRVEDLKWGDYTLVETKAPAGYELDETERPFTISRDRLDFAFEEPIVNKQAESPQLPFTGGIGTTGYIIGGAALLLAGAAAAAWQHRRRVQGRS
ncbi:SpaA isopeptide-forming pilin-related protein [Brevibacterium casei]|uniref:SpaA isopeptide-forming pilin-related protein n=2 Tax=Bacteria TaxID=2 RepID=UPI000A5015CD|nr:SpaA isopeptide-forming pilin-related protein [Brevibacterium casei]